MRQTKLLILGGSGEAAALARALAGGARYDAVLSLAGRTEQPVKLPVRVRRGGFGGAEGLARFLTEERIDRVIDATHPFAVQMKVHAIAAAREAGVPLVAIRRAPWVAKPGDIWTMVGSLTEAAAALGEVPKRVFLTTGRDELRPFVAAPQHFYLIRSVEAPARADLPPQAQLITARGPFVFEAERVLLEQQKIDVIVSKNSGGEATKAKLEAARALGLPVIMVRRPELPDAPESVASVEEALAWLEHAHGVTNSA
jgi:precorrin-6A/cobalt-precorrin-6A reductase